MNIKMKNFKDNFGNNLLATADTDFNQHITGKNWINHKNLKKLLTIALMTLMLTGIVMTFASNQPVVKAATLQTNTGTIVSTELINYYGMTDSEIKQIISILHNQGINLITIRLNAFSEYTTGSSSGITTARKIITEANNNGIQVNIDIHTWYTTLTDIFASSTKKAQYITYVRNVISQFNDNQVYAWMVMNEPPAKTATTSDNNFILQVIAAAKEETTRPVSVRFMGGYSPDTGHYSKSIDDACDYLCRNVYWDPRSPSTTKYGVSNNVMNNMIANAEQRGKALWITEFGKSKTNLSDQAAYIKAFVSYAKSKGIEAIFAWVTQNENPSGETYNIFNGYTPYPAFYELVNDNTIITPPIPNPTPTPTPNPTPTGNMILQDGFETANINKWTGKVTTYRETATLINSNAYNGTYCSQFTSNGQTSSKENAYIYKTINEAEIYARGYFKIGDGLSLSDNGDRFYLLELYGGSQALAGVGIRRVNGIDNWVIYTRDGSGWVGPLTTSTPKITENRWYCIELHWKQSSSGGIVELFVDGAKILEATNINTSYYGNVTSARFGISSATSIQNGLIVYGDEFALARTRIGQ